MIGTYLEAVSYLTEQNTLKPGIKWEVKEKKDKRSQDSNSYFWVLVNKIAKKQHLSDTEVHDKLLSENYAYYHNEEGGIDWKVSPIEPNSYGLIVEQIKDDYAYYLDSKIRVKIQKVDGKYIINKDGDYVTGRVYWHIKGTHQMDSKEMSRILESTIFEAQQLGIETMTPAELEQLKGFEDAHQNKSMSDKEGS